MSRVHVGAAFPAFASGLAAAAPQDTAIPQIDGPWSELPAFFRSQLSSELQVAKARHALHAPWFFTGVTYP